MTDKNIESLLKKLPGNPGVYKFIDSEGTVLYIGKAKNLNNRVRTYFRKNKNVPIRTKKLIENTKDIEWIELESEWEALMLETNLIKEFIPKYNVMMKDDKNFVYIKITKDEDYPRIKIVRKVEKDNAKYFGPKTSAHQVKKTLTLLQKLFLYRSCDLGIVWEGPEKVKITKKTIAYPCLDFYIKRCAAPCIAKISPADYKESIQKIEYFLEGKTKIIEDALKEKMQFHVKKKEFEKAAILRDKLNSVIALQKKQIVTSTDHSNVDIFGFVLDRGKAYFNLFMMREGKLINQDNFLVDAHGYERGEENIANLVLESFLFQYYLKAADYPSEILLPLELEETELFVSWLSSEKGSLVKLHIPQKGKKHKLLDLARKNAESYRKQQQARWDLMGDRDKEALEELKNVLKLKKIPKRIECFDISHLGGTDTVSSMVVFENAKAKSSDYRKFRLRSIKDGEIDDFKSMEETLKRRLSKLSLGSDKINVRKASSSSKKDIEKLRMEWIGNDEIGEPKNYFIASIDKKKVGMLKLDVYRGEIHLLSSLYVSPKFRHKGVASKLIKYAIKKTKSKRFYTLTLSEFDPLFKVNGFEPIKIFPKNLQTELKEFKKQNSSKNISLFAYDPKKDFDSSFAQTPDLIVVDGGKGQLSSAVKVRDELGLKIPIISLAKRFEDVYVPGKSLPVVLAKDSQASYLLQRIRDEAHRFAISFQKQSRKKYLISSELDKVPGIGKTLKMKLLSKFGSVEQIKKASKEEIAELTGEKLAVKILEHLT